MNDSRRSFIKKAALLAGGGSAWNILPGSIEKAFAISPDKGTTFYDAEHVVMLMQENRSFDHMFGTLRGVRGFNDPLAISLPDKNSVWFQPDKSGNRFVPFRLDIKDTKATWMGGVPHSWEDQVDARNEGKYDGWIEAKRPGNKEFKHIPLAMGYYTREDIPFYYSLADAFTICDQHFCAALTGTTTNRSYFWTGKTHGRPGEKAKVRNGELTYDKEANWSTFPERLEEHGISWKVYQNEVSLPTNVEDESLLANFTDNNLEWFSQYGVRFATGFHEYLTRRERELTDEIKTLEAELNTSTANKEQLNKLLSEKNREIQEVLKQLAEWNPQRFQQLSARQQSIHRKAFTTNIGDPDYHKVEDISYFENGEERVTKVPKGDILYQFRKDVEEGKLPTVSWLVAPQKFSDHPSAPWYGAWYVSEVLDILTKNPEVWKKTIFILNYDENDGYFDHIPPFVAPRPNDPHSGKLSAGLDVSGEFVSIDEEVRAGFAKERSRTSPVGLGFRVPLIIASPWSRGGWVNSEVCDLTSTILFLEKFLSNKTGKKVEEPNISSWRRAISGDLTSAFRPYKGEDIKLPNWLDRNKHMQHINSAQFRELPNNFKPLTGDEVATLRKTGDTSALPKQEPGTKPSNALRYELHVDGKVSDDGSDFVIRFKAGNDIFGEDALGSAFNVYAPGSFWNEDKKKFEAVRTWSFAVKAGDMFEYHWPLKNFGGGAYQLRVYGPNGFFREFAGRSGDIPVSLVCEPVKKGRRLTGKLEMTLKNSGNQDIRLHYSTDRYQKVKNDIFLPGDHSERIRVETVQGWYYFTVHSQAETFKAEYAGRLETGAHSITDPHMA